MAKRHHSSKRARHAEHMGMEHYERGPVKHHSKHHSSSVESHGGRMDPVHYKSPHRMHFDESYAGEYARRTQEMQDAGMIHNNPHAIANLPQEVMIKPYPRGGYALPEGLDDTISGVDHQMSYDDSKRAATMYPKKV